MTTTPTTVRASWLGKRRFAVRSATGAPIVIDADKVAGSGPVDTLLGAFAACAAIDVLGFLAKRRSPASRLEIVVHGERQKKLPARVVRAQLEFHLAGARITATHAERAIELAIEKYCSVAATLARDVIIESVLVLDGKKHAVARRRVDHPA